MINSPRPDCPKGVAIAQCALKEGAKDGLEALAGGLPGAFIGIAGKPAGPTSPTSPTSPPTPPTPPTSPTSPKRQSADCFSTRWCRVGSHRGWARPVALPEHFSELQGPLDGLVRLPLRVYSSGHGPGRIFDLGDDAERIELYELVLTEGEIQDVVAYLHPGELRRVWPRLWLPEHVREAWRTMLSVAA